MTERQRPVGIPPETQKKINELEAKLRELPEDAVVVARVMRAQEGTTSKDLAPAIVKLRASLNESGITGEELKFRQAELDFQENVHKALVLLESTAKLASVH